MNAIEHGKATPYQRDALSLKTCYWSSSLFVPFSDYPQDWSHPHLHCHRAGWKGTRGVLQVEMTVVHHVVKCKVYGFNVMLILTARLKKIQEKKKQLREKTELEIAARLAKLGPIAEPANMLTEETDEDLLFEWSIDFTYLHIYSVPVRLCLLIQVKKGVFVCTCLWSLWFFFFFFWCWTMLCDQRALRKPKWCHTWPSPLSQSIYCGKERKKT